MLSTCAIKLQETKPGMALSKSIRQHIVYKLDWKFLFSDMICLHTEEHPKMTED